MTQIKAVVARRAKPYLLLLMGIGLAGACWAELAYRLRLYERYGSEPYLNHVAEGYFILMYGVALAAILCFVVGAILAARRGVLARALVYGCAALMTLCYAVALFCMHDQKWLVTYGEFAGRL